MNKERLNTATISLPTSQIVMRSDAKLGMALGMLVVGFAIAFCFPREGRVSIVEQVVRGQNAENSVEIEFVPIRELRTENSSSDLLPEIFTGETSAVEEVLPSEFTESNANSSEADSHLQQPDSQLSLKAIFDSEQPSNSTPPQNEVHPAIEENKLAAEETYLVQQGDTLSEISMKTLGSYGRYLDIFAANRDQLDSPDDLRLGMLLKIPASEEVPSKPFIAETNVEEVLPKEIESNPEVQPEQVTKKFGSPGNTPFLSDRGQKMPVHQIPSQQAKTHTVQTGDSLERIAVRYFGTVRAVRQIHLANPELVNNPKSLKPGTVLKLVP